MPAEPRVAGTNETPVVWPVRRWLRRWRDDRPALTKLLSNPVGPLKTLLDGPHWIRQDSARPPRRRPGRSSDAGRTIAARHPRAGRIVEAIVRVLSDRQEAMQAKEVHAAVEALLGESVRWSSIKAALAGNIAGPSPRFVRVARGATGCVERMDCRPAGPTIRYECPPYDPLQLPNLE